MLGETYLRDRLLLRVELFFLGVMVLIDVLAVLDAPKVGVVDAVVDPKAVAGAVLPPPKENVEPVVGAAVGVAVDGANELVVVDDKVGVVEFPVDKGPDPATPDCKSRI